MKLQTDVWDFSQVTKRPSFYKTVKLGLNLPGTDIFGSTVFILFFTPLIVYCAFFNSEIQGPLFGRILFLIVGLGAFLGWPGYYIVKQYKIAQTKILFDAFVASNRNAFDPLRRRITFEKPKFLGDATKGEFLYGVESKAKDWLYGLYLFTVMDHKGRVDNSWLMLLKADFPRPVPEIRIFSKQGYNLNAVPWGKQYVSFEGDFEKYFSVYVSKNKELEALYVLSPELMARLIDEGQGFSFMLEGNSLFVMAPDKLRLTHKNFKTNFEKLARIIQYFDAEFSDNTKYYRSEQLDSSK